MPNQQCQSTERNQSAKACSTFFHSARTEPNSDQTSAAAAVCLVQFLMRLFNLSLVSLFSGGTEIVQVTSLRRTVMLSP